MPNSAASTAPMCTCPSVSAGVWEMNHSESSPQRALESWGRAGNSVSLPWGIWCTSKPFGACQVLQLKEKQQQRSLIQWISGSCCQHVAAEHSLPQLTSAIAQRRVGASPRVAAPAPTATHPPLMGRVHLQFTQPPLLVQGPSPPSPSIPW